MNYAEQIAAFEAKSLANANAMQAIMQKAADEGSTLDASQQEEFDGLVADNEAIASHLGRLKAAEKAAGAKATPVEGKTMDQGTQSRAPATVKAAKPEAGVEFARLARVKALAKLDGESVRTVAREQYGEASSIYGIVSKAAVPAGTSIAGNWAAPLVGEGTQVLADFVSYLRPRSIIGRFGTDGIPSLTNVPANVPILSQINGGEGYWVGQAKAKPLTLFGFDRTILESHKVANIAVVSEELIRQASPSAELLIRDQLVEAIAARLDVDFVNPSKAAVAGVSPASITNGVTPVVSSGSDADAIRADVRALMATFIAARNAPKTGVWLMSTINALSLGQMVNPLGQPEFGGLTMEGGRFAGMPVIVSDYLPADTVVLVNASDIYLVDDGGVQVDLSREASLEMSNTPTHDAATPTGTELVSLWQNNSVGLRVERFISFKRRRESAVAILTGATWGAPTGGE